MLPLVLLWLAVLSTAAAHGARGSPWSDAACIGAFLCFVGMCIDLDTKG